MRSCARCLLGRFITSIRRPEPLPEDFELDGLCAVLLRESPVPTCITTREGNAFVEVNEACARLFGYSREEMLWRTAKELNLWVTPVEPDRLGAIFREQGVLRGVESRMRAKSGELRHVLVFSGIAEYAGPPHVVTMSPDLTERKQMQARLLLADRMASVGTLAAGAALGEALHGADRVQTIIGDLKTFSRETQEPLRAVDVKKVLPPRFHPCFPSGNPSPVNGYLRWGLSTPAATAEGTRPRDQRRANST